MLTDSVHKYIHNVCVCVCLWKREKKWELNMIEKKKYCQENCKYSAFFVPFTQSVAKLKRHLCSSTIYSRIILYVVMAVRVCTNARKKEKNQLLQFVMMMMLIIIWTLFAHILLYIYLFLFFMLFFTGIWCVFFFRLDGNLLRILFNEWLRIRV